MTNILLNREFFFVNGNEFIEYKHPIYNNLKLHRELPFQERIIGFLNDLSSIYTTPPSILITNPTHGGFIPIKISKSYNKIFLNGVSTLHLNNINKNISTHKISNILLNSVIDIDFPTILMDFREILDEKTSDYIITNIPIVITKSKIQSDIYIELPFSNIYNDHNEIGLKLYVPRKLSQSFLSEFQYYIRNNEFDYDNLLHMTIMVKNGGTDFHKMLSENINNDYINRWTILDTGSTDNTIDVIKDVLKDKKYNLYQEPFIDFGTSRNRCLNLAGHNCKFIMMLDDTYIANGELKKFLREIRSDQFCDSFSLYIQSNDCEYTSNRIIKSHTGLRYLFKIHEVITPENNVNVCVPSEVCRIDDFKSSYMEERTYNRKQLDLTLLFEEIEKDPSNPRHYYYVAQTYNYIKQYDLSLEYFLKRATHPNDGFLQEKIDAYFEAARISNFQLHKPWGECEELYLKSYNLDKTRPESMYFIGIHHYLENNYKLAYEYLKKGFEIGYPHHAQHSLKPTLSFHFLPYYLTEVCYHMKDWETGLNSAKLFLEKNTGDTEKSAIIKSWVDIFTVNSQIPSLKKLPTIPESQYVCLLIDNSTSINEYVLNLASHISKIDGYRIKIFSHIPQHQHEPIQNFQKFIASTVIEYCIIVDAVKYLDCCYNSYIKNIYLLLSETPQNATIILNQPQLKKVLCPSKTHKTIFDRMFSPLVDKSEIFYYGITPSPLPKHKTPFKFMYIVDSPTDDFSKLLWVWSKISREISDATLSIYSEWNNNRQLIMEHTNISFHNLNNIDRDWQTTDILLDLTEKPSSKLYYQIIKSANLKTLCICLKSDFSVEILGDRGILIDNQLDDMIQIIKSHDHKKELTCRNANWVEKFYNKYVNKTFLTKYLGYNFKDSEIDNFLEYGKTKYQEKFLNISDDEVFNFSNFTNLNYSSLIRNDETIDQSLISLNDSFSKFHGILIDCGIVDKINPSLLIQLLDRAGLLVFYNMTKKVSVTDDNEILKLIYTSPTLYIYEKNV